MTLSQQPQRILTTPKSPLPPAAPAQQWHHHLTLDLLLTVLNRTLFHPWPAWIVVLSLRAQVTPYTDPSFIIAAAYATFLTLLSVFKTINRRIAYGSPRTVDLRQEVVVVTGGASGLGQLIARTYAMRGVSVAVLDVKVASEEVEREVESCGGGYRYYQCDIGDRTMLEDVIGRVEKELGVPTILINCAAARINGLLLLSLPLSAFQKTLQTNLLAVVNTTQVLLPRMLASPTGGTIVNISSVLGHLTAAGLSDYSSSKAALSALHRTLESELRSQGHDKKVKLVLVETGQIATPLFAAIRTPNRFLAPVLEPVQVAREVVRSVDEGRGGVVRMPAFAALVDWYAVLPGAVRRVVRWLSGIDEAVDGRFATAAEEKKVH